MKVITIIQIIFECLVCIGYFIGIFPFGYLLTLWFVIPLTITNFILSAVTINRTISYTLPNTIMAFLSLIPILGVFARIVGFLLAIFSIQVLAKSDKIRGNGKDIIDI